MRRDSPMAKVPADGGPVRRERPAPQAFANIRADLRAHGGRWGAQGFWALVVYRFGRWRYGVRPVWARKLFSGLYRALFKLVQIVTGIELPCEVVIGHNFVIDHHGGIVISGYTRFGNDCRIRSGVCIGLSHVGDPRVPVIGNGVDIGTGAKLLGPITIGDNVLIGANAVVLCDVRSDSIAVGVPAKVKSRKVGAVPLQLGPELVHGAVRARAHRRAHRASLEGLHDGVTASVPRETSPAPGFTDDGSVALQLAVK
jgi:serine O-acetyltransferase